MICHIRKPLKRKIKKSKHWEEGNAVEAKKRESPAPESVTFPKQCCIKGQGSCRVKPCGDKVFADRPFGVKDHKIPRKYDLMDVKEEDPSRVGHFFNKI